VKDLKTYYFFVFWGLATTELQYQLRAGPALAVLADLLPFRRNRGKSFFILNEALCVPARRADVIAEDSVGCTAEWRLVLNCDVKKAPVSSSKNRCSPAVLALSSLHDPLLLIRRYCQHTDTMGG
jgi:hypothetical protein